MICRAHYRHSVRKQIDHLYGLNRLLETEAQMPKIDVLTRKYISRPDRFAELFNTFAFDGTELVMSEDLSDLPPSQNASLSKTRSVILRERDLLKLLKIMTDGETQFVLLGAENQTAVHYGMPVRVMVYDALQYALQIEEFSSAIKQKAQKPDRDEFLSGMMKNAKIKPVITLVIYWGSKKWDGPVSLYDMFDPLLPKSVVNSAENYRMSLLDMNAVPDEVIDSLKTDLKQVLYFRKYAENPARLSELLNSENSIFESVARDAAELLSELTNTPIRLPKDKGETVNMCEAVRQMCLDAARVAVMKAKAESEEELSKVKAESEEALSKVKAESEEALTKVKAESEEALSKVKAESEEALTKLKSELETAEMESIRNSFALLSGNTSLCMDDIVNAIAMQFKKDPAEVRKIVKS